MQKYIKINENDNVVVALLDLPCGMEIFFGEAKVVLIENIAQGHKFSLVDIGVGEDVIKYGYRIGTAKEAIQAGSWVHVHNLKTSLSDVIEYDYQPQLQEDVKLEASYFKGYKRAGGKVAVRNEIWVIPTVGCVNNVVQEIARQAKTLITGNTEDVVAFPHPYGCSQMGDDQDNTRKVLCDLIHHPNAGGVLVLGLGCENSNIEELKKVLGNYDENRVRFVVSQDYEDEVAVALDQIKQLNEQVSKYQREKISCEELIIGLKCGGSDGLSGITANPTVGRFSDLLIGKGGTTILTEVPEMFGAETILMNRCEKEDVFEKTVNLINDFKDYFKRHDQVVYENPSPGNKKGGISTLEDKSLGCTQKSGNAVVRDVLSYGDRVNKKGLNLLSAPGNDLVAATALAAAGAHIVLFTTGRGTPFASPVPTIKISSNSRLKEKKQNWIDFDCGRMLEEEENIDVTKELFDFIIEVASGKLVKAEEMGYHDMAIFKQGVTL